MVFSTSKIVSNAKIINNLNSDYVFLDVKNSKIYLSNNKTALQIEVEFSDVKDDENKIFVIGREDFMHICLFTPNIHLSSDYKYKSDDGKIKGKFTSKEDFADTLESVKIMFDNKDSYKEFFTLSDSLYESVSRSSIFVDGENIKNCFRCLDIKDGYSFSSSDFRVYRNKIDVSTNGIIEAEVVRFILSLGIGTKVYNNNDSYLLEKDGIEMYFSTMSDVEYIPVLENAFKNKYESLFEKNSLKFKVEELLKKMDFVTYYAKVNPNNFAYLNYKDGKVFISTNEENSFEIESLGVDIVEDCEELKIPFNALSFLNIIQKLQKNIEEVTIYVSSEDSMKLFLIKFTDEELVILAKINV